jgi:hypothetical protein
MLLIELFSLGIIAASPSDSVRTLDKLTVTDKKVIDRSVVSIKGEEQMTGMVEDVDKLLIHKKGIDQVAEAGSLFLIHGNGIYDNLFIVGGIPVFPPSHYAGSTFADRSGISMASIDELLCYINNMPGKFADFPGGVIKLTPRALRTAGAATSGRPELLANFGSNVIELFLSSPVGKNKDLYQIGASIANKYTFTWLNSANQSPFSKYSSALDFGEPNTYFDITFNGTTSMRDNLTLHEYFIHSSESFTQSPFDAHPTRQWGIGSLSLEDSSSIAPWRCSIGGASQYYLEGKKYGPVSPIKIVRRNNELLTGNLGSWHFRGFAFDHELRLENLDWNGTLSSYWTSAESSGVISSGGKEQSYALSTQCRSEYHDIAYGLNVLCGFFFPGHLLYVDPGFTARKPFGPADLIWNCGIQSIRPDIRGLPDTAYRKHINKDYSTSLESQFNALSLGSASIEAYCSYKNKCPSLSIDPAQSTIWDPKRESPLTAYGLNFTFATKPLWNMSLTSTQNFGQSKRIENGRYVSYEWEMPWSNKTGIRLGDSATAFQCFIMGTVCAGLPYHELGLSNGVLAFSEQQKRVPVYRNIDLKIQSAQQTIGHRYLTRLNGFVEVHNLLNILDGTTSSNPNWFWENTREYYWTDKLEKEPVTLEYFWISVGVRIGLQL